MIFSKLQLFEVGVSCKVVHLVPSPCILLRTGTPKSVHAQMMNEMNMMSRS